HRMVHAGVAITSAVLTHSTVWARPVSKLTPGSYPRRDFAWEMPASECLTSPTLGASYCGGDPAPTIRRIKACRSAIVTRTPAPTLQISPWQDSVSQASRLAATQSVTRSEERRVGKEWRSRW